MLYKKWRVSKIQYFLKIKKEPDTYQVLIVIRVQYLHIIQVKMDIYTKNKYILILQSIILKRKAFCQFFYCKFNKTTYCTIRLICHKDTSIKLVLIKWSFSLHLKHDPKITFFIQKYVKKLR